MMYERIKGRVYNLIRDDDENGLAASLFDGFIIAVIAINVLLVILDTFRGIQDSARRVFYGFEVFSVTVFSIEYALRLWTADRIYPERTRAKARLKYIASFMAVVDILAILPFYVPFLFPIDLRVLRMVRLLRLLRLLKVNRYTSALSTVGDVIKRKAAQLLSSMFVVIILMVMASILMYGLEGDAQPEVFQNAFSGFWWAIATLTTVGYGDIYPVTIAGRILGSVIALLGIGLVAVPTGIISAGFMENIAHEKEHDKENKRFCPYCGKDLENQ